MKKMKFKIWLLAVVMLLGAGSVFGATHISEGFSTISLPSGWSGDVYFNSTANIGNLTGDNGAGFNANNKYLQLPSVNSAGTLTFWIKGSAASSQISIKVQKSVGGGAFTDIATFDKPHSTTASQKTVNINDASTNIILKFVAYDRNGNSIYLDDIELTDYSAVISAPTTQASSITFSSIGQNGMTANWTNGNGAKRVVIMNTSNSFTAPADATDPTANTAYSGNGQQVVFNGSGNSVAVTGLSASTTYWFRVYEYNGSGATTKYITTTATNNPNSQATTAPTPLITLTPTTLTGFTYVHGAGPSTTQTFTVSGSNLYGNISIAAPTNYEISKSSGSGFETPLIFTQSGGTVSETTVYVRLKSGLSVANYNSETITASSTGATDKTVTCSGSVTAPPAPVSPTATAATSVTSSGFTANWNAVSGATGYRLDVYEKVSGGNATDLFISEYIDGSSGTNKAIEIFNGTGAPVDLSNYRIWLISNGGSWPETTINLTGTLANNDVFVITNGTDFANLTNASDLTSSSLSFNGDDAIGLAKNISETWTLIDAIGVDGADPGTGWNVAGITNGTVDRVLTRKSTVNSPNTDWSASSGTTTENSEWIVQSGATNTEATGFGSHTFAGGSSQTNVSGYDNLDVANVTSIAVSGLDASTEYFYVVRAYNGSGSSASSNEISVTTSAGASPLISVSPATLTGFTYAEGSGPSAEQSFTVSGSNITNNISIAASTNYEISKTSGSGYATPLTFTHSGGTVTEQTVYVRLKSGLTQGTYNSEVINITSTGASAKTVTVSGSVTAAPTAEPSNHATAFVANTNSTTQITVTWTDASGGADSYIIKGSSVSAAAITAPVDGTAEADAALVKNIATGVGSATFTGLTASTTYYFKVYPYNGTGTGVNYKTDGSVPTVNTTTLSILEIPTATASSAITATGFTANWDAVNSATGYYLDVYTKTAGSGEVTVSQGFDNGTTAPDNWTFSSISGTYTTNTNYGTTSPSLKLDATDASVLTPILPSSATELSFWIKGQSASGGSTLLVEGYNGSSWVTIQSIENPAGTGTTYLYTSSSTPALPSNLTQFRFTYTKVTGNIAFDDVIYKYGSSAENTSISGSPFTVNSSNSKIITGLTPGTEYFYTVRAKRSSDSSVTDASNEISVITDFIFNSSVNASDLAEGTTRGVVIEDGGHLTIDENRTFASVTVETGGKLTLNNGFTFEPGTFTIEDGGTFVDERSDATKTAINATVNVELTGSATAAARQWWYVSSPVAAATAAVFNPEGDNNIGYFDETLSTPNYVQILSNSDPLHVGKGYLFQNKATATYTFTGALNTGDVTLNLTRTGNSAGQRGFHIVGNPYPSYLNWKNAFDAGTTSNVRNTIWYRTTTGSANGMKFLTFNAATQVGTEGVSGVVPPMQGFWMKVHADNSNGVIKFTNDMRSHATSPGNSRKAPAVDNKQLLRLQVSNSLVTDEMVLVGIDGASDAFEKYDSEKMANNSPDIPELYTLIGSQEIAINSVEALTIGKQFILGFRPGQAGSFSIKATELTNLENVKVILKDNQLNIETELLANEIYTFTSDATATTNRFSIEFRAPGATTSLHEVNAKNTLVYVNEANQIEVQSVALSTADRISVFNLAGQQLVSQAASGQVTVINEPFGAGVYLVKVNSHLQKVIVK